MWKGQAWGGAWGVGGACRAGQQRPAASLQAAETKIVLMDGYLFLQVQNNTLL